MRSALLAPLALLAAGLLAACDDSTGFVYDPVLFTDTVEVYAPLPANVDRPTALDVSVYDTGIGGARFPERSSDAGRWDFVVRQRGADLVLVPGGALGVIEPATGTLLRSSVTRVLDGETFESLLEAPGSNSFVRDSAVVLRTGGVYGVRSRDSGGIGCSQYGKLQPLLVDVAAGRVRVQVTSNRNCSDLRLAEED